LRANAEGTKRSHRVRPQTDSYSANAEGKSLYGVRSQADSYRGRPRYGTMIMLAKMDFFGQPREWLQCTYTTENHSGTGAIVRSVARIF